MNWPLASPAALPSLLSVFCAFVLRITVGYLFCVLLARFATSARLRFAIWLGFLSAAAMYWAFCFKRVYEAFYNSADLGPQTARGGSGVPVVLSVRTAQVLGKLFTAGIGVYLGVLAVVLIFGLWKRVHLYRAIRYRHEVPQNLRAALQEVASELRAPQCSVWLLPGLSSPASVGWLAPAIYLPSEDGLAETAQLHQILLHELSHVRRRDGLWDLVARICRGVLFFHPLIHRAFSSLRLERELACDLVVVRSAPAKRDLYADTLVRLGWKASAASGPDHIGIGFTSQATVLTARIQSILRGERVYSKWSSATRAALGTGACWSFAAIVPLLWVGFSVALPRPSSVSPVLSGTHVHHRVHHGLRARLQIDHPTPLPIAPRLALADPPVQIVETAPAHPRYHIQNEDEPMSNPVTDSESASVPDSTGRTPSGKSSRSGYPSASSVIVDAATRLATMGGGHDRDHDHD